MPRPIRAAQVPRTPEEIRRRARIRLAWCLVSVPVLLWAAPFLRQLSNHNLVKFLPCGVPLYAFLSLFELVTGHTFQEIAWAWDAIESRHRFLVIGLVIVGSVVGLFAAIWIGSSILSH